MFAMLLLLGLFLVLFGLLVLFGPAIFEALYLLTYLLHLQRVLKDRVAGLKLLLPYVYHGVLHHLQECLILGACGLRSDLAPLLGVVELRRLLLPGQLLNGLAQQEPLSVVGGLGLLIRGAPVLVHPVEALEAALGDDALADLDQFELLDLLLLPQLLHPVRQPLVLLLLLGLRQPHLLDVLEGRRVPRLLRQIVQTHLLIILLTS